MHTILFKLKWLCSIVSYWYNFLNNIIFLVTQSQLSDL